MKPDALSHLHAAAFAPERGWSAQEFSSLLSSPHVGLVAAPHGFAVARTVAGESELLTLAVDPAHRRQGIGRDLVYRWLNAVQPLAQQALLEVAADNAAAHALYCTLGFREIARRPAYYLRKNAAAVDAIVMRCHLDPALPPIHAPKQHRAPESG